MKSAKFSPEEVASIMLAFARGAGMVGPGDYIVTVNAEGVLLAPDTRKAIPPPAISTPYKRGDLGKRLLAYVGGRPTHLRLVHSTR